MRKLSVAFTAAILVAFGAVLGVFLIGMRTKSPLVQDRVRKFNKAIGNPQAMKTAGQPGAWTAVVRHVGRTSGTAYETPVEAHPTDDGFVISMPYGVSADWVQNVLTAGSATIVRDGEEYRVEEPEIVPTESVLEYLPERERKMLRWFAVEQCLLLRRAEGAASTASATRAAG